MRDHAATETMQQVISQEMIENGYNRKHIDAKIRQEIMESPELMAAIAQGVILVQGYLSQSYYKSKDARIAQLKGLDLEDLVFDIIVGVSYFQRPELMASAAAQLASRLHFDDKVEAITTVSELLAVICETDCYHITKDSVQASLMIQSCITFSDELMQFIDRSRYLPPMVCVPLELKNNYDSGYLTHKDGLVLGKGNNHDGDLCLDVLNTMNQVALSLNTEFISKVEEIPTFDMVTPEQIEQWDHFKTQSYATYRMMTAAGNKFFLTHKVDMRGRIYSQGYHINTEGVAHKKAMVELHHKELVTGVPGIS